MNDSLSDLQKFSSISALGMLQAVNNPSLNHSLHSFQTVADQLKTMDSGIFKTTEKLAKIVSGYSTLAVSQNSLATLSKSFASPLNKYIQNMGGAISSMANLAEPTAQAAARLTSLVKPFSAAADFSSIAKLSKKTFSWTSSISKLSAATILPLHGFLANPLISVRPAAFPTFISPEVPYNIWLAFKNDPPLDWLHQVLYEEGTALYEVANPLLINKLYQASSPRGRKQVLAHNLDLILNDCLNISSQKGRSKEECRYSAILQDSLKAIKSGSPTSGLSLIGALLDELNTMFIVPNYFNATSGGPQDRVHGKRRWDNHSDLTLRAQIALKPLPHWFRWVYKKSANDSQWDKRGFSRHRIAHHPSSALITKSNCAQAALAATSILALIFEWKPQY